MMLDPTSVRVAFAAGKTYRFLVPSSLQSGVLEDLLADLAKARVSSVGYDVHPHELGCVIELREKGECMVDADLMHVDLRLLQVGEYIDHHVDTDEEGAADVLALVEDGASVTAPRTADSPFQWLEAFLPARYTNEEFGDAEEEIHQRVAAGCSPWWVRVKIATTIFWVLVHIAVEEYARFKRALRP